MQTPNQYDLQDIAIRLRINMEDADRGYSTRELLRFVGHVLDIPKDLPEKQRTITLGLWLKRHLLGRPVEGWILKSWIGGYNIRLYKFHSTDLPDDVSGIHAEHVQQLHALRESLESDRKAAVAAAENAARRVAELDAILASIRL